MDILQEILVQKKKEVEERRSLFPVKLLEKSIYFNSNPVSLKKYLLRSELTGIIAEFKRKSPSKGFINKYADLERTTVGYMQAGASALSVLTDANYFGGKNEDLGAARKFNFCPILRKDFTVDEYQVLEAKSIGADVILLIAAALSKEQIKSYTKLALDLGMEVLLEIHAEDELDKVIQGEHIVGVNNRDLKSMKVSLETSLGIASKLPANSIKVTESGINKAEQLVHLKEAGYNGFLMGEFFMKHSRPEMACMNFIKEVKQLQKQTVNA
ncbi:MAG: indole-3-glycerol phosphate synthase TrpC [Ignavibacteriales bacterium]|nr:indole-3-glycerol phosphate synthase TrpC [Ignavibacteriales bacterium]